MTLHTLLDIEIGAPEPTTLDEFYQEIGFVGSPGSWGGEGMQEQIKISEAPYRQLKTLRVACTNESDLAGIGVNLDALGVEYQIINGQLLLVDPINKWQLIVEPTSERRPAVHSQRVMNYPGERNRIGQRAEVITEKSSRKPRRLGHVVVGSPNPQKTVELMKAIGFRVSDIIFGGIATFMRCSSDHHNLLVAPGQVPYLNHYAIEHDDFDSVMKAATIYLGEHGQEKHISGPGRHQIGGNIFWYMLDPAGNFFEFFADMDQIIDDDTWEPGDWSGSDLWSVWGDKEQPEVFFTPTDMEDILKGWKAANG